LTPCYASGEEHEDELNDCSERPSSGGCAAVKDVLQSSMLTRRSSAGCIVQAGGSGATGAALATHEGQLDGDDERSAQPTTVAEVGGDGERRAGARTGELEGRLGESASR
jgi:hypothetical protein